MKLLFPLKKRKKVPVGFLMETIYIVISDIIFYLRYVIQYIIKKQCFDWKTKTGMIKTVAADSSHYQLTYDENGKVTEVTQPDGSTLSFAYDKDGNLSQLIHANRTVTVCVSEMYINMLLDKIERAVNVQECEG